MFPIVSVVFTLILIEVFLTLFFPIAPPWEVNMIFEPDPFTGYRIKPNSIGYFRDGIPGVANSYGQRNKTVSLKKTSNDLFRILVLGDSFTVGANVRQEEAYPQVLEVLMNNPPQRPVEVINAGVGGWNPFQYAQYYEQYGKDLDPDLILVGFFVGNDTFGIPVSVEQLNTAVMGRRVSRQEAVSWITKPRVLFYAKTHIGRLIANRGLGIRKIKRDRCDGEFPEPLVATQRLRLQNHLKRSPATYELAKESVNQVLRIKRAAEQKSKSIVVVLIPDENQLNAALQKLILNQNSFQDYDFKMPQSMLTEMFHGAGIFTIDLLPPFLKDGRCLYMNDTHWSPEGHKLAAEIIAREIGPFLPVRRTP
jgi:hypothetical protein